MIVIMIINKQQNKSHLWKKFAKFLEHICTVKITVIVKVQLCYQVGNSEQLKTKHNIRSTHSSNH